PQSRLMPSKSTPLLPTGVLILPVPTRLMPGPLTSMEYVTAVLLAASSMLRTLGGGLVQLRGASPRVLSGLAPGLTLTVELPARLTVTGVTAAVASTSTTSAPVPAFRVTALNWVYVIAPALVRVTVPGVRW